MLISRLARQVEFLLFITLLRLYTCEICLFIKSNIFYAYRWIPTAALHQDFHMISDQPGRKVPYNLGKQT